MGISNPVGMSPLSALEQPTGAARVGFGAGTTVADALADHAARIASREREAFISNATGVVAERNAVHLLLGDSIIDGSGTTNYSHTLASHIVQKQFDTFGGTYEGNTPIKIGMPGRNAQNLPALVGHVVNADNAGAAQVSQLTRYGAVSAVLQFGRNDTDAYRVKLALRAGIDALARYGLPVIVCTAPPAVDGGFNLVSDTYQTAIYPVVRQIALERGATLVDINAYFMSLYDNGAFAPSDLMADTVHPNDQGHDLIAAMVWDAMNGKGMGRTHSKAPELAVIQVFDPVSGGTVEANAESKTSVVHRDNADIIRIASGTSVTLSAGQMVWEYAVVSGIGGAGQLSASIPGAGAALTNYVFPGANMSSVIIDQSFAPRNTGLVLSASGGDVLLAGVAYVGRTVRYEQDDVTNVRAGTWTEESISTLTGNFTYQKTTEMATAQLTVEWVGKHLTFNYIKSASVGEITATTDGSQVDVIDCYTGAGGVGDASKRIDAGEDTYHKTVFTFAVSPQNPASTYVAMRLLQVSTARDRAIVQSGGVYFNERGLAEVAGAFSAAHSIAALGSGIAKRIN